MKLFLLIGILIFAAVLSVIFEAWMILQAETRPVGSVPVDPDAN